MERKKLKQLILCRDLGRCRYPGCNEKDGLQMAHRIADTKSNKKEIQYLIEGVLDYGITLEWVKKNIIDHPFNVVTSCAKHNDYFNIGFNKEKKMEVIFAIINEIMEGPHAEN